MRWSRLTYKNKMRHVVPDALLLAIRENMDRATPPGLFEGDACINRICLEQGGACYLNRPYEEFVSYDLTIRVPSEDLQPLLLQWRIAPQVTSRDQNFYRFTSWPNQCLVITPEQRADLLTLFHAGVDQAEDRATAFWANRKSPQELLREHYAHKGIAVPYEPDKAARFRS